MSDKTVLKAVKNKDATALEKALSVKGGAKSANARGELKRTALIEAVVGGSIDCVELLIKAGADVNALDFKGQSALHFAAKFGDAPCVKALIKAGADIEASLKLGSKPLRLALSSGSLEAAVALVEAGADTVNFDGAGKSMMEIGLERLAQASVPGAWGFNDKERQEQLARGICALAEACEIKATTGGSSTRPSSERPTL